MSEKYCIVYNTSPGPIELDDEAGIQVLPQEFGVAERHKIRDRIQSEELVVINGDTIKDDSAQGARAAKAEYERLKKAWEKEKDDAEPQALSADYDDSDSKPVSTSASASAKRTK
jgi:hypothetical protein